MITRPKKLPRYRPSFTLLELLVAIAILGIMAGMALYSLAGAQTDARNARTRATISKLNEIVLQRWEEYRYRPVDVRVPIGWRVATKLPGQAVARLPYSPREKARVKMVMLRDMMRMELPDRVTDLLYPPTQYTMVSSNAASYAPTKLDRPIPSAWGALYMSLYNRVAGLKAQGHPDWTNLSMVNINAAASGFSGGSLAATAPIPFLGMSPGSPVIDWNNAVQSSELLYLIVASSDYNGSSALEFFRPSEVGDPDDDGLLEFVDAWDQPIQWIRWPAGYSGDLVRYASEDAMDPLKTDWRFRPQVGTYTVEEAWKPRTLVPLILSPGQDGTLGVIRDNAAAPISYALMTWPTATNGKPYGTAGPHYTPGDYYYPDPHFTWEMNSTGGYVAVNSASSEMPFPANSGPGQTFGFRANQLGAVPKFIDPVNGIENTFAEDNITNHDIILEP